MSHPCECFSLVAFSSKHPQVKIMPTTSLPLLVKLLWSSIHPPATCPHIEQAIARNPNLPSISVTAHGCSLTSSMTLMNAMTLINNTRPPCSFHLDNSKSSRTSYIHHICGAFNLSDRNKCCSQLSLNNTAKNQPILEDFGCYRRSLLYGENFCITISIGMTSDHDGPAK